MKCLTIVIFAADSASFEKSKKRLHDLKSTLFDIEIVWCNSNLETRTQSINKHLNKWIFFIDYDIYLENENLQIIHQLMLASSEPVVCYAGLYKSPSALNYFQKSHNFIANNWLLASFKAQRMCYLLGGCFLIKTSFLLEESAQVGSWGAEDKKLSIEIQKKGINIKLAKELRVNHVTAGSVKHFLKRSFLHGSNDYEKPIETNYRLWIQNTGFSDLYLWPAVLFHFFVQRWARIIQKFRQMNKLKKLK